MSAAELVDELIACGLGEWLLALPDEHDGAEALHSADSPALGDDFAALAKRIYALVVASQEVEGDLGEQHYVCCVSGVGWISFLDRCFGDSPLLVQRHDTESDARAALAEAS